MNWSMPSCTNRNDAEILFSECTNHSSNNNADCQFCAGFHTILPPVYTAISILSALCCFCVLGTYFCLPRLRQTGYSSKVFLNRTIMDLVIAIGHIIALAGFAKNNGPECSVLGAVNEFALVASNLWYVFLAVDLIKAIRNPFSSQPSYGWLSILIVLLLSLLYAATLSLLAIPGGPGGPGRSMFYWCWTKVDVRSNNSLNSLEIFSLLSLFFFYALQFILWIFSLIVIIVAGCILWGHLAASSETRKFVLKQNLRYVLILGIETIIIVPIWVAQLGLLGKHRDDGKIYFLTNADLVLAILFAMIHSLRGTVDLVVWMWTFSIGPTDITDSCRRCKIRFSKEDSLQIPLPGSSKLDTHLLIAYKKDNLVNKALRRNAIYCINVGILDAVQLHMDKYHRTRRVGSVVDTFSATALMELDEENERDAVGVLYDNPTYSENVHRKIRFPASSSHLKDFAFIDMEPTVFNMLRECYGISPRVYRKSFEIKNAADIDSSLMLEKFTEGKSGSFFYFTQDFRFIIKTVTPSEEKFLSKIAYRYYTHMRDNRDSLLVRFYGLHKVRLAPEQRYITVVVMENIFHNTAQLKIHRRFDLKGSRVGRRALKTGKSSEGYNGTLKDLDLGEEMICIGPEQKEQLMEQLQKDVQFLISCKIMDYSLLLGIHQHNSADATDSSKLIESQMMDDGFTTVNTKPKVQSPLISPERKTISNRHSTITSMGCELYIPWFRQDMGGLRSTSRLYPGDNESCLTSMTTTYSHRDSMVNVPKPAATYFFGVVDILQQYTLRKNAEHLWKTRVMRQDRQWLSAVNEQAYGERFLKFLDSIIE